MAQRITINEPSFNVPVVDLGPVSTANADALGELGKLTQVAQAQLEQTAVEDAQAEASSISARERAAALEELANDEASGAVDDAYGTTSAQKFAQRREQILSGISNPYTQKALGPALEKLGYDLDLKRGEMVRNARDVRNYRSNESALNNLASAIYADPAQFAELYQTGQNVVGSYQTADPRRKAALEKMLAGFGENALLKMARSGRAAEVRDILAKGAADYHLDGDRLPALASTIDGILTKQENDAERAENKAHFLNYLKATNQQQRDINAGNPISAITPDVAMSVGPENAERLEGNRLKSLEDEGKAMQAFRVMQDNYGKGPLDPKDKTNQLGMDTWWNGMLKGAVEEAAEDAVAFHREDNPQADGEELDNVRREARASSILAAIKDHGIIPNSLIGEIRAGLRSNDPAVVGNAASLYTKLVGGMPQTAGDFNEEDVRLANAVKNNIQNGATASEAVTQAREERKQAVAVSQEQRSAIAQRYVQAKKPTDTRMPDKTDAFLDKAMTGEGWFSSAPRIPDAIRAKFDDAVRREYEQNGNNYELALKSAFDKFNTVYGVSTANGRKEVMRNPPEEFYGIPTLSKAENGEWIRKQAEEDAWANSATPAEDRVDVIIHPLDRTYRGRPVYGLSVVTKQGSRVVEDPKKPGEPMPWFPDDKVVRTEAQRKDSERRQEIVGWTKARKEGTLPPNTEVKNGQIFSTKNKGQRVGFVGGDGRIVITVPQPPR